MAFQEDLEFCHMLVKLKPLLPKAKDPIQIIVEELECGSITSWCKIKPLLIELYDQKFSSISEEEIETFFYSVLTLFEMHKYSDISVIADFLEILCLIKYDKAYLVKEKIKAIRFNDKNFQTSITMFERILVLPYKDISTGFHPKSELEKSLLYRNCVKLFTELGEVRLLKAVVSFGTTLILPQDSENEKQEVLYTMMRLFDIDVLPIFNKGKNKKLRDEDIWYQNMESQFHESTRKRLFYVSWVLQVLVMPHFYTAADEYVQCIKILTKSTPEPLITCEEIKSSITKLCTGVTINEKVLQEFLEKYKTQFPENCGAFKPRSLKHLSRFQVRENLRVARSFPHGVVSLHVPKQIQDCICLKDILLY